MALQQRMPQTRWGAFGYHLCISIAIFALLILVTTQWLYPGVLYAMAGGWQGFRIVAGVDLILGPALTLIIYNIAKPRRELIRDLSIIGLVQFSCLFAGMYLVYQGRPVVVAWVDDQFFALRMTELVSAPEQSAQYPAVSLMRPTWYEVELPEGPAERETIALAHSLTGGGLATRTDLYRPLPADPDSLKRMVFAYNRLDEQGREDCIVVQLATPFETGPVCLDAGSRALRRHRIQPDD